MSTQWPLTPPASLAGGVARPRHADAAEVDPLAREWGPGPTLYVGWHTADRHLKLGYSGNLVNRLRQHRSESLHWRTLGWCARPECYEEDLHEWAKPHRAYLLPARGRTEWYLPDEVMMHLAAYELLHQPGGVTTPAWWRLWLPGHDLDAPARLRCRYRHCTDRAS